MNWTLERYGIDNETNDLIDYFYEVMEADEKDLIPTDYWFFKLFMTELTPFVFWGIAIIGLIANIVVIMGKILQDFHR